MQSITAARREEERQARTRAIKEAAWKVFLRDGFLQSKIADIAKECRLGLSTLYYYFTDKRQLVYALMLDFKDQHNRELQQLLEGHVTYREFLQQYISIYLEDIQRFTFFVMADSYYNYLHQYDLKDPVLQEYDRITREEGTAIVAVLCSGDDGLASEISTALDMITGYLRRYALLPEHSRPAEVEKELQLAAMRIFTAAGIEMDRSVN